MFIYTGSIIHVPVSQSNTAHSIQWFLIFLQCPRGINWYNTRLASQSSFCLPKIRTNYGKFNIRFNSPKFWSELPETTKSNSQSKKLFKTKLIAHLIESYWMFFCFFLLSGLLIVFLLFVYLLIFIFIFFRLVRLQFFCTRIDCYFSYLTICRSTYILITIEWDCLDTINISVILIKHPVHFSVT